jgi:hypothetical protein
MSDLKSEVGKEIFVCVVRDKEVYDGVYAETVFSSCKKFLEEVMSGRRKTFHMFFGKGKVLQVTNISYSSSGAKRKIYDVLITKIYLKDKSERTIEGQCVCYSQLWAELGNYAKEKFLSINPSRRKLIEGLEGLE